MKKFSRLLAKFPRCRLLVVGDVMLDRFVWGDVHRINPEAPVPVLRVSRETCAPGGAANAAANAASLRARVTLVGLVGRDPEAAQLGTLLRARRIAARLVSARRPTSTKTRAIARGQQLLRLDYEDDRTLAAKTAASLLEVVAREAAKADAVLVSDYGKGVVSARVIECLRERCSIVTVDPVPQHVDFYRKVTLITPNTKEAGQCQGAVIRGERDLRTVGRALAARLGSHVLVTRGSRGMALFREGREDFDLPTLAKEVIDVTGAGDTVIATVTLALAAGARLERAVELSNVAAGLVVSKVGTATVTAEELSR